MSFKLSKAERDQRNEIMAELSEVGVKLGEAVQAFNDGMEELKTPVEAATEAYNAVVAKAREFAEGIASQAEQDISEKSDKWQEGERGQAAVEFQNEWENLQLDDLEIDYPDEINFDDPDHFATLEQAPEELAA